MLSKTLAKRISIVAAAAGLGAVGILAANAVAGQARGTTANLRPICNNNVFNMPASLGETVTISIRAFAADPDVTPVKLVAAANYGAQIGTVRVAGDHELEFTLTSSTPGTVNLYWTISDG